MHIEDQNPGFNLTGEKHVGLDEVELVGEGLEDERERELREHVRVEIW